MSINLVSSVPSYVVNSLKESVIDSFKSAKNQKIALIALAVFSALALIGFGIYRYMKAPKAVKPVNPPSGKQPESTDTAPVSGTNATKPTEVNQSTEVNQPTEDNASKDDNASAPAEPIVPVVKIPATAVDNTVTVEATEEPVESKPKIQLDRKSCIAQVTSQYSNHPTYKPVVTKDEDGNILTRDDTKLKELIKFFEDKFDEEEGAFLKDPIAFVNKWIAKREKEGEEKRFPEDTVLAFFRNKFDL